MMNQPIFLKILNFEFYSRGDMWVQNNVVMFFNPLYIIWEAFLSCNIVTNAEVSAPRAFSDPLLKNPSFTRDITKHAIVYKIYDHPNLLSHGFPTGSFKCKFTDRCTKPRSATN